MPFLPLSFYLQYLIYVIDSNLEMLYLAELRGFRQPWADALFRSLLVS